MRRLSMIVVALGLFAVACGPGEVGQNCAGGPAENDCVDGAICTPERSTTAEPPGAPNENNFFCRAVCEIQADCDEGFLCRRVEGSMAMSCQPDPDYVPPMSME